MVSLSQIRHLQREREGNPGIVRKIYLEKVLSCGLVLSIVHHEGLLGKMDQLDSQVYLDF